MLKVFKPEVCKTPIGVRVQAKFVAGGQEDILWYEVDKKYADYLVHERADGFVVGLLWYALTHGHDIEVLSPMSERLYYTLNKYLSPLIAQVHGCKTTNIMCDQLDHEPFRNQGAVGTGLSCGIDSFSTIYDHMGDDTPDHFKITHFTFFNVGSHGGYGGKKALNLFKQRAEVVKSCANQLGKELILLNSNLSEILQLRFQPTHTLRSISGVLVLQKLFNIYYYSSGVHAKYFELTKKDMAYYDIFNLNMLSTESLTLFSSGAAYTRLEKTRRVAEFEPSYKYLNVCVSQGLNCGKCFKCKKTLLTLELLGKIDNYFSVFDLDAYYKEKQQYINYVIANKNSDDPHLRDIYREMIRTNFLSKT
ncbi:hypothetical protein LLE49_25940 [Alicyclobacillus tolerans]|uniref:hypothetical protein n=1 Tax=Alicyclobacillus tolerans TaxID=90970 RepID=UPI001F231778|nr:hypothetical protein [Alicyclobacillus tolerans]MCF8568171.1 hypothetical protein [Alicyclobacillus tolerans]